MDTSNLAPVHRRHPVGSFTSPFAQHASLHTGVLCPTDDGLVYGSHSPTGHAFSGRQGVVQDSTAVAPLCVTPGHQLLVKSPSTPSTCPSTIASHLGHLPLRDDVVLDIDESEVEVFEQLVLGSGAVGSVCKGRYKGNDVAVKVLTEGTLGGGDGGDGGFNVELQILGRLDHPNIVKVFGGCMRNPQRCMLVEERCRCSLAKVLSSHRSSGSCLPLPLILKWSIEIFSGLVYLHSLDIIHMDLKPGNVLVDEGGVAKISDFGLAQIKHKDKPPTMQMEGGTVQYMAPECLGGFSTVSTSSDVYSAAIMMGEMINQQCPWSGFLQAQVAYQVVVKAQRPPIHERCPPALRQLLLHCYRQNPTERPDSQQVLSRLLHMQAQLDALQVHAYTPMQPRSLSDSGADRSSSGGGYMELAVSASHPQHQPSWSGSGTSARALASLTAEQVPQHAAAASPPSAAVEPAARPGHSQQDAAALEPQQGALHAARGTQCKLLAHSASMSRLQSDPVGFGSHSKMTFGLRAVAGRCRVWHRSGAGVRKIRRLKRTSVTQ